MQKQLTSKQRLVLVTISDLNKKLGHPPTFEQLRNALGYTYISSVQRHTDALREKGYLDSSSGLLISMFSQKVQIPLIGNVAAGTPILAVENIEAYIPYESSRIKINLQDHFFLRAIGDSMNKASVGGRTIDSGDFVLVRKQNTANYGEIVVALIGEEATIKRLKKGDGHIILEPMSSNAANKPIYVIDDFVIQGVVIDVVKGR